MAASNWPFVVPPPLHFSPSYFSPYSIFPTPQIRGSNISSLFSQTLMQFARKLSDVQLKRCLNYFLFSRDGVHLRLGVPPLRGLPHPRLPQRHLLPLHLLYRRGRPREQRLCSQQQGSFSRSFKEADISS